MKRTGQAAAHRIRARLGELVPLFSKFMISGVPGFTLAVPLNWTLVRLFAYPAPAAYAVVLAVQMTVNFVICRRFVFGQESSSTFWRQYSTFMVGNLAIRSVDWALYSAVVAVRPAWFLGIQFANVALFSVVKFVFARHVFLKKNRTP